MDTRVLIRRSKYGTGRLARAIEDLTSATSAAQIDLYDELGLSRAMLHDNTIIYEKCTEALFNSLENNTPEMLSKSMGMLSILQPRLQSMLDTVRKLARTISQIEQSVAVTPDAMTGLASSLERAIDEEIEDEGLKTALLQRMESLISTTVINARTKVNAPTILSPWETVKAIDAAVPICEGDISDPTRAKADAKADTGETAPTWKTFAELEGNVPKVH